MRRLILAFLICLLPLQSFASGVMGAKMASMNASHQIEMTDATQAPCHDAFQPMQAADQDCCGLQGMCQALCHVIAVLPSLAKMTALPSPFKVSAAFAISFQSADLSTGFKPPLL